MAENPIAIDFETFYSTKSGCSVKPLGAEAYCRHPDFYAYLLAVYDGTETWVGHPRDFNWAYLEGKDLLAHNMFFDWNVVLRLIAQGIIPDFTPSSIQCTANMTAAICNRRSLADACMFLLGEEIDKGPRGEMDGKHWADVQNTDLGLRFMQYAGLDPVKCWELHDKFGHAWSPFERALSQMTLEQCLYGVQLDIAKLEEYLNRANLLKFQIQLRMPWIAAGSPPTSPKAVNEYCRSHGIPCCPVKSRDGEEAFELWEKTYAPLHPCISAVSQWRSINKFIATLETLKRRARADGTLSFGMKYFGAHTGRWSGDAGFNIQNLKRDPILVDKDGNIRLDTASANEYWAAKEKGTVPDWLDFISNDETTAAIPIAPPIMPHEVIL